MRFVMFFYCNMCHASEGSANLIDSINFRNLSGNSSRKTFSKHILGNYENLGVFSLLKFIQIILKIFLRVLETPDSSVQLEITPAVPSAILLELPSSENSSSTPSAILPEVLLEFRQGFLRKFFQKMLLDYHAKSLSRMLPRISVEIH